MSQCVRSVGSAATMAWLAALPSCALSSPRNGLDATSASAGQCRCAIAASSSRVLFVMHLGVRLEARAHAGRAFLGVAGAVGGQIGALLPAGRVREILQFGQ
jgi:hypothetical protein